MIKLKNILISLVVYILTTLFLQSHSAFHFYFMEQKQLFLFGKDAFMETISQFGGGALYVAQYLTQFFIYPYAGALITAALLVLVAILMQRIVQKIAPNHSLYLFYYLPPLALLMMHFDFNYFIQGTIAFIWMQLALLGCLNVKNNLLRWSALLLLVQIGRAHV